MRKNIIMSILAIGAVILLFADINAGYSGNRSIGGAGRRMNWDSAREIAARDYITGSGLTPAAEKKRTILVYMNGSDLETEHQSATTDLREMLDSGFDEENMNVIIFAGGSRRWHTPGIADGRNSLFKIENGGLVRLAQIGRDPMGYPETLAGFINFGYKLYPAEEYGLILWNHGGGAILGYGHDERFRSPSKSMMKLSEIESALKSNELFRDNKKFEFLGFDTCLMATFEMALIAEKYAEFLIASEELEPEPGWYYIFLGDIKPEDTGREIGKYIVDYFGLYYSNPENAGYDDITTLSLTDLSKIKKAADSFETLAGDAADLLGDGNYRQIARARSGTRMFGGRGEHAGETDMIDLRGLSVNLRSALPEQTRAFERDLSEAVIYKFERNISELGGLSIYFPFENKDNLSHNLAVYRSINRLPEYTGFLEGFAVILESRPLVNYRSAFSGGNIRLNEEQMANVHRVRQTTWKKSDFDGRYIQIKSTNEAEVAEDGEIKLNINDECININGRPACLYPVDYFSENEHKRFTVPVKLNGKAADLLIICSREYPDGKVTGAIPAGVSNILDKKIVQVKRGDKISILYYCKDFNERLEISDGKREGEIWQVGEEFIVGGEGLALTREKLDFSGGEYLVGISISDLQGNKYFSNLVKIGGSCG